MALILQHQTADEFALRFWHACRDAFQAGNKEKYHRMIWWLWTRIQAGDITSTQARNSYNTAFGASLNVSQWNTLTTNRLVPIKDRYVAWLAESMV